MVCSLYRGFEERSGSEWFDLLPGQALEKEARYIGVNGMNVIPKHLSSGLKFTKNECGRIGRIKLGVDDRISEMFCQELVLASSAGCEFIKGSNLLNQIADSKRLASVNYERIITYACFRETFSDTNTWLFKIENKLVSWIADNSKKDGFSDEYCITVHANLNMRMQLGTSISMLQMQLIESIQLLLGSKIVDWHIHRWRMHLQKSFLNSILS